MQVFFITLHVYRLLSSPRNLNMKLPRTRGLRDSLDKWHKWLWFPQGRNEVRWRPGHITNSAPSWSNRRPHGRSLAPLWSNLSSFESKFTVLKKVLVILLGLFGTSSSNSAPLQWFSTSIVNWRPGNCAPLAPPRYVLGFPVAQVR